MTPWHVHGATTAEAADVTNSTRERQHMRTHRITAKNRR